MHRGTQAAEETLQDPQAILISFEKGRFVVIRVVAAWDTKIHLSRIATSTKGCKLLVLVHLFWHLLSSFFFVQKGFYVFFVMPLKGHRGPTSKWWMKNAAAENRNLTHNYSQSSTFHILFIYSSCFLSFFPSYNLFFLPSPSICIYLYPILLYTLTLHL